uniref:Uncharacterized protein n=1 Tax=Glossina pallidipes TaxID=7398 RepID=A0A1B0ACY8_GLOPL
MSECESLHRFENNDQTAALATIAMLVLSFFLCCVLISPQGVNSPQSACGVLRRPNCGTFLTINSSAVSNGQRIILSKEKLWMVKTCPPSIDGLEIPRVYLREKAEW